MSASDTARLLFVMKGIDGFVGVEKDKYEFACDFAMERGREEPNARDEADGMRKLIDEAMKAGGE